MFQALFFKKERVLKVFKLFSSEEMNTFGGPFEPGQWQRPPELAVPAKGPLCLIPIPPTSAGQTCTWSQWSTRATALPAGSRGRAAWTPQPSPALWDGHRETGRVYAVRMEWPPTPPCSQFSPFEACFFQKQKHFQYIFQKDVLIVLKEAVSANIQLKTFVTQLQMTKQSPELCHRLLHR